MSQVDKIPAEWRNLVAGLQLEGIGAVLAGGAMRDLYCGRSVKDVDIFVLNNDGNAVIKIMKTLGGDWEHKSYTPFTRGYQLDYVIERKGPVPIQVIGAKTESTEGLLKEFDYGLCQIAWDGARVIYTQRFLTDFLNGTFTLTNVYAYERAIQRYKTWTEEKYKGWRFVPTGIVLREQVIRSLKGIKSE